MLNILLTQVSLTVIDHYDKCITRSQRKQASNNQRSIFDSMKRSSNVKQKQHPFKKRKVVEDSDIEISSDDDTNEDSDESNNMYEYFMRYYLY